MNHFLYVFATFNGVTGILLGAGWVCLYKAVRVEAIILWHAFSRACALRHIKQTTLDNVALKLIEKARPAITQALDEAHAGLEAERLLAAAVEADTTAQTASLMPKPVTSEPLAAPAETTTVATVATVAQTTVAAP